ncbi:MAG: hypothetical protein ACJ73D_12400 [Pyrinomonadaceae bacterium]
MKLLKLSFAGVAVCVLGFVCNAQVLKRTTTKTDTIPLGAGSTVAVIGAPTGTIKVSLIPGNDVQISAEIEVQAANEADLSDAAVLTTYVTQETLGKLAIVSIGADSRRKFTKEEKKLIKRLAGMPYRIDYVIGVPRYTNVEIDGGIGDISLEGDEGDHRINAVNSKVNVSLRGGNLAATIAKGELNIQVPPSGRRGLNVDASVVGGEISMTVPENLSGDIDASILRTGKVVNEIPKLKVRDRKLPFTEKLVQGRAGAGGPAIKLTVGDGSILLRPWMDK